MVVLWDSLYLYQAAKQLAADGFPVTDDLLARLSPLQFDHINFLGRYAFFRPQIPRPAPAAGPGRRRAPAGVAGMESTAAPGGHA